MLQVYICVRGTIMHYFELNTPFSLSLLLFYPLPPPLFSGFMVGGFRGGMGEAKKLSLLLSAVSLTGTYFCLYLYLVYVWGF